MKKKKRNQVDTTLRNNRATRKREAGIERRLRDAEAFIKLLVGGFGSCWDLEKKLLSGEIRKLQRKLRKQK